MRLLNAKPAHGISYALLSQIDFGEGLGRKMEALSTFLYGQRRVLISYG